MILAFMNQLRCVLFVSALLFFGNTLFGFHTVIIYMRSGDSGLDQQSESDLAQMLTRLNTGGRDAGYTYSLVKMSTFDYAKHFNVNRPQGVNRVMIISHGELDSNGNYTGRLLENSPRTAVPDDEVDPHFFLSLHCNERGRYHADEFGAKIAQTHGHNYGSSGSPPGGGSGGSGGGNGGGGVSGYWLSIEAFGQYGYLGPDGVYYVIGYHYTVWVWVSEDGNGNQHLA